MSTTTAVGATPFCSEAAIYRLRRAGELISTITRPVRLIDLFCGAGGLTLGFGPRFGHSFRPVWANDFDSAAIKTYQANFGNHCQSGDICSLVGSLPIPHAEVVVGGPPCQGFSLLNKKRGSDSRKRLWQPFMAVVEQSGADYFLMENVPQLLGSAEHREIVQAAEALGFRLAWAKLCAADYGVAQTRWRAFILGSRLRDPASAFPPKKTHFSKGSQISNPNGYLPDARPWRTVRKAITDLRPPMGTQMGNQATPYDLHFGRNPTLKSRLRYQAIPDEGMNRFDLQERAPEMTPKCWRRKTSGGTDLFGRLWWDRPSFTIRTEFFKPEKGRYLHPEQHRPITHREAARLQSFPDDFVFRGSKTEVARQIGNAVPPLLAARLADCVYSLITSKE